MKVEQVRVGDVLELQRIPVTVDPLTEYTVIGISPRGKGFLHRRDVPGVRVGTIRYFTIPPNALVLSTTQAGEGALAVSGADEDGCVASNRLLPYLPKEPLHVDVRYLLHYFLSEEGLVLIRRASTDTQARNRTSGVKAFEDLVIPLPDLPTQGRVAARLDTAASGLRALEARARALELDLTSVSDALVSPVGSPVRVGDLLELQRRVVTVDVASRYREIGLRSFGRGVLHQEPVTGAELSGKRVFEVHPGDLVISNVLAWEGAVAVAGPTERSLIGSHRFLTCTPRPNTGVEVRYLSRYLASQAGLRQLQAASAGSTGRHRPLSIRAFEDMVLLLPDLPVQRRVADRLDQVDRVRVAADRRADLAGALLPALRTAEFARLAG